MMALTLISNTFELCARYFLCLHAFIQGIYEYCVFQCFFTLKKGYTTETNVLLDNFVNSVLC